MPESLCNFKWITPQIPEYISRLLPEELNSIHHLDGWAAMGPELPFLFFRTAKKRISQPNFLVWGWDGTFGATLTVSAYCGRGPDLEISRVCVKPSNPVFNQIRHGRLIAVFVNSLSILATGEIDVSEKTDGMSLAQHWSLVRDHIPVFSDEQAHYWEILDYYSDSGWPRSHFTPSDNLSIGWIRHYKGTVRNLDEVVKLARPAPPLALPDEDTAEELLTFMRSVNDPDLSVSSLLSNLLEMRIQDDEALIRLLLSEGLYHQYCHSVSEHAYCMLLSLALKAHFLSSEITNNGHRVVCVDEKSVPSTNFLYPKENEFPNYCSPEEYWFRLPSPILECFGINEVLDGTEIHHDLNFNSSLWDLFPISEDPENAFQAADGLIEEALSCKKWSIPNAAIVKLNVGPFNFFQVWELEGRVLFLARSDRGEYSILILNLNAQSLWFDALFEAPEEKLIKIEAALKLLLSAIVRDFYVVESRENVFATAQEKQLFKQRLSKEGPVTVYLPRIKSIRSPNLQLCARELGHQDRRAHFVRAHIRKSDFASEHQLILASRYGLKVPEGHTFVRPHHRGHKVRETVYISRSALQSLYQEASPRLSKSNVVADWFKFENDVRELMIRLGFLVDHVGASRGGDHGVDVFARKGSDLDEVSWVVQCKCYSPKHKVGPSVIQALIGVLQEYPRGTRGMVVTTSSFTSGASRIATEANIRLMDGREFAKMFLQ